MRSEVMEFLKLGRLPAEDAELGTVDFELFEVALQAIAAPVSDEEAEALLDCFGKDACFGLAWALLHLIETSPTPIPRHKPKSDANEWHQLLYERRTNEA